ncbi:MAG TPA: SPOR domain-containing protein [Fermentimonas caenicola]|jgi:cell division protein FtsN|uniref:SPOR domain-containing protein n=1 Tax=Fermentimonas caenicola TaxID=1562970 RepID=A0A098BYR3_9BACT|nr:MULTISPECIES: SPOR domain-containing protein [Lascolabacillus]MBP6174781.1 SPOR domain-containing protein [Fermentimonas sp.]MDI9625296.1 SPOR domain-containing protein [Bacteroidota bacterium]TAH61203.1 MAG: SPOR domain-containing protein [Fermentimonas caenicola]MBP6197422.1 SPOR domain-containing protein [Fermentimonas sp.]MBP7103947.1 SPOR domain-containing protein [Fermentimonas sp.]
MKKFHLILFFAGLLVLGTSCKPKQSAYKQVYEAAKEREIQQSASQPTTVVKDASPLPPVEVSVRKEKVEPVYATDAAGLKRFNVVIASLSVKLNAESLKSRMENEGHKVILAENEQGMYRVIVASYDTKEQAAAKRNEIYSTYTAKGDTDYLRRTYGVPFNDLWILERDY